MGRIKTKRIKRYTRMVMKESADFTPDFTNNKKVFSGIAQAHSKKIRNIISGYAARLAKKKLQSE